MPKPLSLFFYEKIMTAFHIKSAMTVILAVALNTPLTAVADDPIRPVYMEPARHLPADVTPADAKRQIKQMLGRMTLQGVNTIWLYVASMDGKAYYRSDVLPQRHFTECDILEIFLEVAKPTPIKV